MNSLKREGKRLRQRMGELRGRGFNDSNISVMARVSISTIHKIYRDDPTVLPTTYIRVLEAFEALEKEARISA